MNISGMIGKQVFAGGYSLGWVGGWGSVGSLVGRCHQVVQSSTGPGLFSFHFNRFCCFASCCPLLLFVYDWGDNHFNLKVPGCYVDELVRFMVEIFFIEVIPKKFGDVNRCEPWGSCSIVPSSWSKFNAAFFTQHRLPVHELTSLSCGDKEGT